MHLGKRASAEANFNILTFDQSSDRSRGSVLGALLFIIAIDDLPKCNLTDTIMNADDTTSFGKSGCLSVLYNTMAQTSALV